MNGLKRWLGAAAVLAATIASSAEARAQTAVTFMLDGAALGRHAAWYVALEKGYYKRAGLDVTIVPGQGPAQAIQGVESKAAQFALSDVASLVALRAGGASAKMVAVIEQKSPYAIFSLRSGANVSRPQQLESLEIGSGKGFRWPEGDRSLHDVDRAQARDGEIHRHRSGGGLRHAGGRKDCGNRDIRDVDACGDESRRRPERADFPAGQQRPGALRQRYRRSRRLHQGQCRAG